MATWQLPTQVGAAFHRNRLAPKPSEAEESKASLCKSELNLYEHLLLIQEEEQQPLGGQRSDGDAKCLNLGGAMKRPVQEVTGNSFEINDLG